MYVTLLKKLFRLRNAFLWLAPVTVLLAMYAMDPDGGISTAVWLASFSRAFLVCACAHLIRKVFFDYESADMERLFDRARSTPEGAGLALIALAVFLVGCMLLFSSAARADVRTDLPPGAIIYAPVLKTERVRFWADHPMPQALGALVEHESCVSLTSPRCWNPHSRLKTAREEGAGMGQITRAYRADGSTRFDALQELRGRHASLGGWSWDNVYSRPDLQLRAIVLMSRDNFMYFRRLGVGTLGALHFGDAAYNGGLGGVQQDRQACHLSKGCDASRWFGNVALHCTKSRAALYGTRSACDINRHHVDDVFNVRAPKYRGML